MLTLALSGRRLTCCWPRSGIWTEELHDERNKQTLAVGPMGCPGAGYRNPKRLGQATQSLYVNVEDVDKHFERAKKAGAKILDEPTDTFYGHRRYGAEDPEGHQWYFANEIRRQKSKRRTRV
ncbi:MAG: VOC family protein [Pyrinomonadaceae bacterium]